jgi:hypothetical protein
MTEGNGGLAYDSSSLLSAEKVSNGTFELGSEKVTNGDFVDTLSPSTVVNAAGTSNITWDAQGGGSAKLIYNSVDSTAMYLNLPNVNMVNGKTYYIVIDSTAILPGSQFKLNQGNGAALSGTLTAGVISSFYRTATVTNSALRLYRNASGNNSQVYINSVSVKEVTDWTIVGNISIINSQANFTGGTDSYILQTSSLVVGKQYEISVDYIDVTVPNNVGYFGTNGSPENNTTLAGLTGSGTKTAIITAASTTLIFRSTNGAFVGSIDNISAKEVTPADNGAITNGASWLTAQSTIPQLGMMDWSKGSNLFEYSQDFNNSYWTKNDITLAAGFTSPTGTADAFKFVATASDSQMFRVFSVSSGTTYTLSFYLKTISGTLDTTIGLGSPGFPQNEGTGGRYKNITVTNDWERYSLTSTADATANSGISFGGFNGFSTNEQVLIWGAQLEVSSSAGNYRTTNGTAVTNAILPPYPVYPTTDVLSNLLRLKLNSINLTGTSVAQVVDSASINPSVITIQCWVFSNTENDKGLVAKWASGKLDYMLLKRTNNFQFYITASGLLSGPIPTTGWVHITATYDGATRKIFINGELSTSDSFSTAIPNSPNNLEIGRYFENNDKIYSERIDDVKLYDRVLSLDEILQNYRAGLSAHPGLDELNADAFKLRVVADGGVFESYACLKEQLTTLNDI